MLREKKELAEIGFFSYIKYKLEPKMSFDIYIFMSNFTNQNIALGHSVPTYELLIDIGSSNIMFRGFLFGGSPMGWKSSDSHYGLPQKPGLYAIYHKKQLLYIGKTDRLSNRLLSGHRVFTSIRVLYDACELRYKYLVVDKAVLAIKEGKYIKRLKLKFNNRIPGEPLLSYYHKKGVSRA